MRQRARQTSTVGPRCLPVSREPRHAHDHCSDRDVRRAGLRGADDPLRRSGEMMGRTALACLVLALGGASARALEEPVVWRDPGTGCAYLLGPQGGIAPRFNRDGSPDCPDARAGSRVVDDTVRGIAQGLGALQREVERLRDRYTRPDPSKPPL
jgi:hypothetical protein